MQHDNSTAEMMGQVVGVLFLGLIGFAVWWSVRRGTLKFFPDEIRLSAIYANCPQHRFGGLIVAGSPNDGRLVLTSHRLIFTNLQEAKIGFAVPKEQILSIAKGSKGPLMTLELGYKDAKGKPRTASFTQIAHAATVAIDPKRELPIGMFIDKLNAWREGRPLPQDGMAGRV